MGILIYYYGVMGSGKTKLLLEKYRGYVPAKILLIKPSFDTRFGDKVIKSRNGEEIIADIVLPPVGFVDNKFFQDAIDGGKPYDIVMVDEAQFLNEQRVVWLRRISLEFDLNILCFGLLKDFRNKLFSASKLLLELSDSIVDIEIFTAASSRYGDHCWCYVCSLSPATCNAKYRNGKITLQGPTFEVGNECYHSLCYECYHKELFSLRFGVKEKDNE